MNEPELHQAFQEFTDSLMAMGHSVSDILKALVDHAPVLAAQDEPEEKTVEELHVDANV